MKQALSIGRFIAPYTRPYASRLVLGILSALIFGISNGAVVWLAKSVVERIKTPDSQVESAAPAELPGAQTEDVSNVEVLAQWRSEAEGWISRRIDPWFPRAERKLDWRQIVGVLVMLPMVAFGRSISSFFASYWLAWVGERAINDLRVDVLDRLGRLSLDFFNRSTVGDMVTRINADSLALQRCLGYGVDHLTKDPVTLLSVFVVLLVTDPRLTLGAMVMVPPILIPVALFGKRARKAGKRIMEAISTQSSLIVEMVSSIRVVKAFGLESEQVERFRKLSDSLVKHTMKSVRARELASPIVESIGVLGFAVMLVFVLYTGREMENMATFFTGLIVIYTPIKKLAKLHVLFSQASVGAERIGRVLHEKPSVVEPDPATRIDTFSTAIEFENVSFSYGHELVLKDIDLRIPRGHRLGVAGESGSGKSTLVNLLFRFFDASGGTVRIDGVDLKQVSVTDLRREMALVSQDIVIFDQTVAENIGCGRMGAGRDEIVRAAKDAYAHRFIEGLPEAYETRVGERGQTLSGGQKQRVCIARAFVRNAPILVLDEATAALDAKAEEEVQRAIDHLAENRTVVCIAHRLSTLTNMDEIVVLSEGRIVERGTFKELLRLDRTFAAMAKKQGIYDIV